MSVSKEQFITAVFVKINTAKCDAIDAIIEIAALHQLDMETAGKIVNSNAALKQLVEQQAYAINQLKKPSTSLA